MPFLFYWAIFVFSLPLVFLVFLAPMLSSSAATFLTFTPLTAASLITTSLLLLGVALPHSGEFTRLLHRLAAAYLLFALWRGFLGLPLRWDLTSLPTLASQSRFSPAISALLPDYLSTPLPFDGLFVAQRDPLFGRLFPLVGTAFLAFLCLALAERFVLPRRTEREFPLLLLALHLGGLLLFRQNTRRDLLLALEVVTLGSYVLVAFDRRNRFSTYAGIQYFLVGALPSASLLLAFVLLYLHGGALTLQDLDLLLTALPQLPTDSTSFRASPLSLLNGFDATSSADVSDIAVLLNPLSSTPFSGFVSALSASSSASSELLLTSLSPLAPLPVAALALILFNLLFKVTAAPFHLWAPSVYGKAPLPSVTFLSIYSKGRVLAFLYKLLTTVFHAFPGLTGPLLFAAGLLSLLAGRVGAFTERRAKSFFVYSSRGHVGFRLIGLALPSLTGPSATFHYLPVYRLSSLLRWGFLLVRGRNRTHLLHFASLRGTDPLLPFLFALLLFSRSGLPPLGGFFVKLDLLAALLADGASFLTAVLLLGTVASFFYYLRVRKILFFDTLAPSSPLASDSSASRSIADGRDGREEASARLWVRVFAALVLAAYRGLIQPPLLALQGDLLAALR